MAAGDQTPRHCMRPMLIAKYAGNLAALAVCLILSIAEPRVARGQTAIEQRAGCPSTDLSVFIKAFAESSALQKRFTSVPLNYAVFDPDAAKTKVTRARTYEAIPKRDDGTLFPNEKERARYGLEYNFSATGSTAQVQLTKPETGLSVIYRFKRNASCWMLVAITDQSI